MEKVNKDLKMEINIKVIIWMVNFKEKVNTNGPMIKINLKDILKMDKDMERDSGKI